MGPITASGGLSIGALSRLTAVNIETIRYYERIQLIRRPPRTRGGHRVSFNRCLVQLEGRMVRCPIELLQSEFKRSEHVRNLFVSYSETLLSQVQQTVACNALHTTEEKMCRWLLMMHDRADGEALPYTHEFLSHMLGANRKSVTIAAQALQAAGLIGYRRGKIQVLDRPGLEKASCECYAVVRERFDAFLTPPSTAVQGDTKARRND
jgi:hypothetical protein